MRIRKDIYTIYVGFLWGLCNLVSYVTNCIILAQVVVALPSPCTDYG